MLFSFDKSNYNLMFIIYLKSTGIGRGIKIEIGIGIGNRLYNIRPFNFFLTLEKIKSN